MSCTNINICTGLYMQTKITSFVFKFFNILIQNRYKLPMIVPLLRYKLPMIVPLLRFHSQFSSFYNFKGDENRYWSNLAYIVIYILKHQFTFFDPKGSCKIRKNQMWNEDSRNWDQNLRNFFYIENAFNYCLVTFSSLALCQPI